MEAAFTAASRAELQEPRILFRSHPSAGRPRRPPRTELQAAKGQLGATGPLGQCCRGSVWGASARDAKARPIASFDCQKPKCRRPGTPRHRRGSPGISARQALAQRQPYSQAGRLPAARERAQLQKTMDETTTPARFDAEAAAPARRGDEQMLLGRRRGRAAARFIVGGAVVLNLVGFVAFRGGRPQPLASTALDAVQIPRRVIKIDDYDAKSRKAYLEQNYADTKVLEAYGKAPRRAMREDLFRMAFVAREGGFSYGRNVKGTTTTLPTRHAAVFPRVRDGDKWRIGNYAFGSVPGHQFVVAALREASRRTLSRTVETSADARAATGPAMLRDVYKAGRSRGLYGDVALLGGPEKPRAARKAFGPRVKKDEVIIIITDEDDAAATDDSDDAAGDDDYSAATDDVDDSVSSTYYDDGSDDAGDDAYYAAADDAGDDGDDVAARAELGGVSTFSGHPALTVWSLRRPQPTMATIARTRAMMETTTATT